MSTDNYSLASVAARLLGSASAVTWRERYSTLDTIDTIILDGDYMTEPPKPARTTYSPSRIHATFNGVPLQGFMDGTFIDAFNDDVTELMGGDCPGAGTLSGVLLADRASIEWPDVTKAPPFVEYYFEARLAQVDPFHFVQEPDCVNPRLSHDCGAQWPASKLLVNTTGRYNVREARTRGLGLHKRLSYGYSPLADPVVSAVARGQRMHEEVANYIARGNMLAFEAQVWAFLPRRPRVLFPRRSGVFGPLSRALWEAAR